MCYANEIVERFQMGLNIYIYIDFAERSSVSAGLLPKMPPWFVRWRCHGVVLCQSCAIICAIVRATETVCVCDICVWAATVVERLIRWYGPTICSIRSVWRMIIYRIAGIPIATEIRWWWWWIVLIHTIAGENDAKEHGIARFWAKINGNTVLMWTTADDFC